jgi:hypothetical protein
MLTTAQGSASGVLRTEETAQPESAITRQSDGNGSGFVTVFVLCERYFAARAFFLLAFFFFARSTNFLM